MTQDEKKKLYEGVFKKHKTIFIAQKIADLIIADLLKIDELDDKEIATKVAEIQLAEKTELEAKKIAAEAVVADLKSQLTTLNTLIK
jgi:hypothetical protein